MFVEWRWVFELESLGDLLACSAMNQDIWKKFAFPRTYIKKGCFYMEFDEDYQKDIHPFLKFLSERNIVVKKIEYIERV